MLSAAGQGEHAILRLDNFYVRFHFTLDHIRQGTKTNPQS